MSDPVLRHVYIQTMIDRLEAGDGQNIRFEVGKLGRVDRFVLTKGGPGREPEEVLELSTEPGEGTAAVLKVLDDLVTADTAFGVMYSNPHDSRYAYCLWCRMIDRQEWATAPKILPLYERRMIERKRICDGMLKRGHKELVSSRSMATANGCVISAAAPVWRDQFRSYVAANMTP